MEPFLARKFGSNEKGLQTQKQAMTWPMIEAPICKPKQAPQVKLQCSKMTLDRLAGPMHS